MVSETPEYSFGQAPDWLTSKSKLAQRGLRPADVDVPDGYVWFRDGSKRYAVYDSRNAAPLPPMPDAEQRRADRDRAAAKAAEVLADPLALFVDTETTGIDGMVVELSAVDADENVVLDVLMQPGCPIEDGARQVHGITDEQVASLPTIGELDLSVLDGKRLIAWNGEFDRRALARSFDQYGLAPPQWLTSAWEDAMGWHAAFVGQWDETHGTYRNHRCDGEHRSASDCVAGWGKLREMAGHGPDPRTVEMVLAMLRRRYDDGAFADMSGPDAVVAAAGHIKELAGSGG